MRSRFIAAALTSALVVSPIVAPDASAQTQVARQGWRLITSSNSACTIGFNDPSRGISYTAAHCGRSGDTVYLTDASGNSLPYPAGVFTPSSRYVSNTASNDWGVIKWNPGVSVEANRFGGGYVPSSQLKTGDSICFHGFTSHGTSGNYTCGKFIGKIGESIYYESGIHSRPGDSGGPVFVPGKGVVGVTAGLEKYTYGTRTVTALRASSMSDGPTVYEADLSRLLKTHYGLAPSNPVPSQPVRPIQVPADDQVQVESSLSDPGSIIGAIVAVLALLIPIIGSFLG